MDTPGLCDVEKRKQAAEAITKALKQEGIYKVFFVLTLDHGRLRPDDIALLQLVLESASELTKYYLIINQVISSLKKKLADSNSIFNILLRGGVKKENLPAETLIMKRDDEIEGESDMYIKDAGKLIRFVRNADGVQIYSKRVKDIQIQEFEKIRQQVEKEINEIKRKNADFEDLIKVITAERDELRRRLGKRTSSPINTDNQGNQGVCRISS